jgi:predicted translin family RNA/ssDNA-binding protein
MTEVTIKIPNDIRDIVGEINEPIYVEAIRSVAKKKLINKQKKLKKFQKKIEVFKSKYKNFSDFAESVPDTQEGHTDWIEWSYLQKTVEELASNIEKLNLLLSK